MKKLKLYGRDAADTEIIAAYMQDALVRPRDMVRLAPARAFVAMTARFCWENEATPMRVRTALRIANVQDMRYKNIARQDEAAVLSLLSLSLTPSPNPIVSLIFSGNSEIELHLEACEMTMEDVSEAWGVKTRPRHK